MLLFNKLGMAQDELVPVLQELDQVPFRLLPIIVCARLEDRLSELIAARLPDNADARRLSGLEDRRASYAGLVRLARAIGVIDEEARNALEDLGRIRNHFAHAATPCESDDDVIRPVMRLHGRLVAEFVLDLPEEDRPKTSKDTLQKLEAELRAGQGQDILKSAMIGVFKDLWLDFIALQHEIDIQGRIPELVRPIGKLPGWD